MQTLRLVRALGPLDMRSVGRDPLLRWLTLIPLGLGLAARGLLPAMLARSAPLLPFDPLPHYGPVMGFALLMLTPVLAGGVAGFLLLDLRDDGVLAALRVTPPTLRGYLAYRLAAPMLLSLALTLLVFVVSGLPSGGPLALLICALAAAPTAPLFALFLGALAANKVQGFALLKAASVLFALPIVARYLSWAWQAPMALNPLYWPAQLYWSLIEGGSGAPLFFVAALLYPALICGLLLRRLQA
jgi:fluoroquinolone transport system permease protein